MVDIGGRRLALAICHPLCLQERSFKSDIIYVRVQKKHLEILRRLQMLAFRSVQEPTLHKSNGYNTPVDLRRCQEIGELGTVRIAKAIPTDIKQPLDPQIYSL